MLTQRINIDNRNASSSVVDVNGDPSQLQNAGIWLAAIYSSQSEASILQSIHFVKNVGGLDIPHLKCWSRNMAE